jgi:hypothetical protein
MDGKYVLTVSGTPDATMTSGSVTLVMAEAGTAFHTMHDANIVRAIPAIAPNFQFDFIAVTSVY